MGTPPWWLGSCAAVLAQQVVLRSVVGTGVLGAVVMPLPWRKGLWREGASWDGCCCL